jgi:nicotinamidase-related amidase
VGRAGRDAEIVRTAVMDVDPGTTAVVLIEYQNDFTSEGGALHGAVSSVMEKTDMLAKTQEVVDGGPRGWRAGHARADHICCRLQRNQFAPLRDSEGVVDGNAFVKGTWGAAIVDELAPTEDDIVIEGKRGLDTFASTNLDFILRSKGIKTVASGGFLTNCCVESTMRSAYENGYQVITLNDCVAATSVEEHENAIKYDYPMFSTPMASSDFIAELKD